MVIKDAKNHYKRKIQMPFDNNLEREFLFFPQRDYKRIISLPGDFYT